MRGHETPEQCTAQAPLVWLTHFVGLDCRPHVQRTHRHRRPTTGLTGCRRRRLHARPLSVRHGRPSVAGGSGAGSSLSSGRDATRRCGPRGSGPGGVGLEASRLSELAATTRWPSSCARPDRRRRRRRRRPDRCAGATDDEQGATRRHGPTPHAAADLYGSTTRTPKTSTTPPARPSAEASPASSKPASMSSASRITTRASAAKALCERRLAVCRRAGVPTLVDPPNVSSLAKYKGATCVKLNRREAQAATSIDCDDFEGVERAGRQLLEELDLEAVIVTVDKDGAFLATRDGEARRLATRARSVADVTGAGDMFLAMLAAARAAGADLGGCDRSGQRRQRAGSRAFRCLARAA